MSPPGGPSLKTVDNPSTWPCPHGERQRRLAIQRTRATFGCFPVASFFVFLSRSLFRRSNFRFWRSDWFGVSIFDRLCDNTKTSTRMPASVCLLSCTCVWVRDEHGDAVFLCTLFCARNNPNTRMSEYGNGRETRTQGLTGFLGVW